MSLLTELETALDVGEAVIWSVLTLLFLLIVISVCGCFYFFSPADTKEALAAGPEERVPLVSDSRTALAKQTTSHANSSSTDFEQQEPQHKPAGAPPPPWSSSSSSFLDDVGPSTQYARGDNTEAAGVEEGRLLAGGGCAGGSAVRASKARSIGGVVVAPDMDVNQEAILSEWAHGVDVTLFSHARRHVLRSFSSSSSSMAGDEGGSSSPGKASNRPRRIKLYLDGAALVWKKDKLLGTSRLCCIPVADITEVTPGRKAFTGVFRDLRRHDFPAKGDERYLTIIAGGSDAIELECQSKDEREALLGGLRIICESMANSTDAVGGGDGDDEVV